MKFSIKEAQIEKYVTKALVHYDSGNYEGARKIATQIINQYGQKSGSYSYLCKFSKAYQLLALVEDSAGNYNKAIEYYQQENLLLQSAIEKCDKILSKDEMIIFSARISMSLAKQGRCYGKLNDYAQAIKYLNYAISEFQDYTDDELSNYPLINLRIAEIFQRMGVVYEQSNDQSAALQQYQNALEQFGFVPEDQFDPLYDTVKAITIDKIRHLTPIQFYTGLIDGVDNSQANATIIADDPAFMLDEDMEELVQEKPASSSESILNSENSEDMHLEMILADDWYKVFNLNNAQTTRTVPISSIQQIINQGPRSHTGFAATISTSSQGVDL